MDESLGGRGAALPETIVAPGIETILERRAIAGGWLKNPDGDGIDKEKLAKLIQRNYDRGLLTEDDRALASLTRNVIAAVGQVMEQEKRDAGGETINLKVSAEPLTDEQKLERLRRLAGTVRQRRLSAADPNGTGGVGNSDRSEPAPGNAPGTDSVAAK